MNTMKYLISKLVAYIALMKKHFASIPDKKVRIILVIGLIVWSAINYIRQSDISTINSKTYDNLVVQRLVTPPPDPNILIIDIDEASLAYMNDEFGRWPWPRDTLASILAWLEQQGAQAVLFDILFSDSDQLNKAADASFAETIANSKASYFPVLRLNPNNDKASEVRASQLKGFASKSLSDTSDITLAVVPPLFESAIASRRLGYHNVYADPDGVLRHYQYWEDKDGWRIWSLPARMAQDFNWGLPPQARPLINWHNDRLVHNTISFKEVWKLSQSRVGQRLDSRFQGKIILLGATATSLFDVKTTPIAVIHPGVDVLATAIDNIKNHNYLLQVSPKLELLFTLLAIVLMFVASTKLSSNKIKWAIIITPTLLMGVSFATLQFSQWYLDLSVPASQGFVFFALLGSVRAYRQNFWSRHESLGKQGLTKAWAVCTNKNVSTSMLLDQLMPIQTPFCLQILCWQRRTDQVEIALWLLRISATSTEKLSDDVIRINNHLLNLQASGKITRVIEQSARNYSAAIKQEFNNGNGFQIKSIFGITDFDYPFSNFDDELITKALVVDSQ